MKFFILAIVLPLITQCQTTKPSTKEASIADSAALFLANRYVHAAYSRDVDGLSLPVAGKVLSCLGGTGEKLCDTLNNAKKAFASSFNYIDDQDIWEERTQLVSDLNEWLTRIKQERFNVGRDVAGLAHEVANTLCVDSRVAIKPGSTKKQIASQFAKMTKVSRQIQGYLAGLQKMGAEPIVMECPTIHYYIAE